MFQNIKVKDLTNALLERRVTRAKNADEVQLKNIIT